VACALNLDVVRRHSDCIRDDREPSLRLPLLGNVGERLDERCKINCQRCLLIRAKRADGGLDQLEAIHEAIISEGAAIRTCRRQALG
jgi:hypothetical protein